MTDEQVKQSLENRGIRLRQTRPDGSTINWSTGNEGGDWLLVPENDYDEKLLNVINNQSNLSQIEKDALLENFAYVIAEMPDPENEGQYIPYLDITIHEFEILFVGRSANVWTYNDDPTIKIIPCETPIMYFRTGEVNLMEYFGKGYDFPNWKYTSKMMEWKTVMTQG